MKRIFDIVASGIGLILLCPLFIILTIWIKCDSIGPVFYKQVRVGRNNMDFQLFKFRSMRVGSDKKGLITVGGHDPRITRSGYYIRKYKLVLVRKFVSMLICIRKNKCMCWMLGRALLIWLLFGIEMRMNFLSGLMILISIMWK